MLIVVKIAKRKDEFTFLSHSQYNKMEAIILSLGNTNGNINFKTFYSRLEVRPNLFIISCQDVSPACANSVDFVFVNFFIMNVQLLRLLGDCSAIKTVL